MDVGGNGRRDLHLVPCSENGFAETGRMLDLEVRHPTVSRAMYLPLSIVDLPIFRALPLWSSRVLFVE